MKKLTNAQFRKLSRNQKRVAVARDVIAWLDANKLVATCGVYVGAISWSTDEREQLDKFIRRSVKSQPCEACALGSMLICYVDRVDSFTVKEAWGGAHTKLLDLFTIAELNFIESFFESTDMSDDEGTPVEKMATLFGEYGSRVRAKLRVDEYDDAADKKLRLICKMIIANRGAVTLPKVPGVAWPRGYTEQRLRAALAEKEGI